MSRFAAGALATLALYLGSMAADARELAAQDGVGGEVHVRQVSSSSQVELPRPEQSLGDQEVSGSTVTTGTCVTSGGSLGACGGTTANSVSDPSSDLVAAISQRGSEHRAVVSQHGIDQVLSAVMTGSGNDLTVRQTGGRNAIQSLDISGADNSLTVEQTGTDLRYVDRFTFAGEGLDGDVVQVGSDLTLIQEGAWRQGFRIEQRGSGPTTVRVRFSRRIADCAALTSCSFRP